jgi:L-asparaginase / beta-aspartyl-peptidase
VVHGGAWAIPDDLVQAHLDGVRNAIEAGWRILEHGGAALDAVEEAVVVMENDEAFDAGRGSFLNREGKVQLDALIMDGVRFAREALDASNTLPILFARRARC